MVTGCPAKPSSVFSICKGVHGQSLARYDVAYFHYIQPAVKLDHILSSLVYVQMSMLLDNTNIFVTGNASRAYAFRNYLAKSSCLGKVQVEHHVHPLCIFFYVW